MSGSNTPLTPNPLQLDKTLRAFGLRNAKLIDTTDLACVFKVSRADGTPAALKLYHKPDMRNEGAIRPAVRFHLAGNTSEQHTQSR